MSETETAVETEAGRMEKMEGHEGAALLVGAEKAVIEELGRKELGKVVDERGEGNSGRCRSLQSGSQGL